MDIDTLALQAELERQLVNPKSFLSVFRLIDESSRFTQAYQDPKYLPFYYYLGKYIQPESVAKIGFRLGLKASCFLKSCKSVTNCFLFSEKVEGFFSPRIGISNIKQNYRNKTNFYHGAFGDAEFLGKIKGCDFIMVDENWAYDIARDRLDLLWNNLSINGWILMDDMSKNKQAFMDFVKVHNREVVSFDTRYGTAMVQK